MRRFTIGKANKDMSIDQEKELALSLFDEEFLLLKKDEEVYCRVSSIEKGVGHYNITFSGIYPLESKKIVSASQLYEVFENQNHVYYWYTHCAFNRFGKLKVNGFKVSIKDIEKAIMNHDWSLFQMFSVLLNFNYHSNKYEDKLLFLPKISKKEFMQITHVEHECG